jgi:hypothetical protein
MKSKITEILQGEGFVVVPKAFSQATINQLIHLVDSFKASNPIDWGHALDGDGLARRIVNLHLAIPELCIALASASSVVDTISSFFNSNPRIYTSLFFEGGSQQPIHRDTPYFHTNPRGAFVGVWVALEDANETNGALEVVRGGHLVGEPDKSLIAKKYFDDFDAIPKIHDGLWNDYQQAVWQLCRLNGLAKEIVPVNAGDVIIWHPDLPHGGSSILCPGKSRKSIVFHVTPSRIPVYNINAFFNSSMELSEHSAWKELSVPCDTGIESGMKLAISSTSINYAHRHEVPVAVPDFPA